MQTAGALSTARSAAIAPEARRVACLGGATLDRTYRASSPIRAGTSNPVTGRTGYGGVARNVCENLARLGVETSLVSVVGDDEGGRGLVRHLQQLGADVSRVAVSGKHPTAEYAAILNPDRSLALGIADMEIFGLLGVADVERLWPHLAASSWVFADCNLPAAVLRALTLRGRESGLKLAINAVSRSKSGRLPVDLTGIELLFVNREEAEALLGLEARHGVPPSLAARALRDRGAAGVVLTLGADGMVVVPGQGDAVAVPAVSARPADVTGAGDALIAGTLAHLVAGSTLVEAARIGSLAAALTVECDASVHPELSVELLARMAHRLGAALTPALGCEDRDYAARS